MSKWEKKFEETIDQREKKLPTLWQLRETTDSVSEEIDSRGVHRSGKQRKLANLLCKRINEAQEVVIVSSFLLADNKIEDTILDAAKRGIRAYLLLATETRLESEPREDSEFDQRVFEDHKKMLNRLAGRVLIRSASDFHAKVLLVDPMIDNCKGILLTANLTKEALERNEELAIELNAEHIQSIYQLLRWAMWEGAEHELIETGRLRAVKSLKKVEPPKVNHGVSFTTKYGQTLREEVIRIIKSASSNLIISSFGWGQDHPVMKLLVERIREGLNVIVLSRVRPAAMLALELLRDAGATVYGFDWLHSKAIWSDNNEGLILTANFETHGLDKGFEIGVTLHNAQCESLEKRLKDWTRIAPWELLLHPKLGEIHGNVKIWLQNRLHDKEIVGSKPIDLGEVIAKSAENLDGPKPDLPVPDDIPELAHELIAQWTVSAPILKSKSKEVFQKKQENEKEKKRYNPPVYRSQDGKLVVAVKETHELQRALEVKKETNAHSIVIMPEK